MKKTYLKDILDVAKLERYRNERYVSMQVHPTLPLRIYNYTHLAQYSGLWDDVTNHTRGLIVGPDDEIIARPFKKFHNLNTSFAPETHEANLPSYPPEVTDKLDGSLGILWRFQGHTGIATRGSFTSEQARWATEHYNHHYTIIPWPEDFTPLFEILYHENRIVVKYDYEGLVLIGLVQNFSGREVQHKALQPWYHDFGIPVVSRFEKSLSECAAENAEGTRAEGYVLTWAPDGLKIKVKFAEYCRLHRLITGVNPKDIWEMLRAGQDVNVLINDTTLPEDFRVWVKRWQEKILLDFHNKSATLDALLAELPCPWEPQDREKRKTIALYLQGKDKKLAGLAISKLLNQPRMEHGKPTHLTTWEYGVWEMIRPVVVDTFREEE